MREFIGRNLSLWNEDIGELGSLNLNQS